MATMLHLVAILCAFSSLQNNVRAALPVNYKQSEYNKKMDEAMISWGLAMAFIAAELVLMIAGFSLFYALLAVFDIFVHVVGTITVVFFIANEWHVHTLWYIFILTVLIPLLAELAAVLSIVIFRRRPF